MLVSGELGVKYCSPWSAGHTPLFINRYNVDSNPPNPDSPSDLLRDGVVRKLHHTQLQDCAYTYSHPTDDSRTFPYYPYLPHQHTTGTRYNPSYGQEVEEVCTASIATIDPTRYPYHE